MLSRLRIALSSPNKHPLTHFLKHPRLKLAKLPNQHLQEISSTLALKNPPFDEKQPLNTSLDRRELLDQRTLSVHGRGFRPAYVRTCKWSKGISQSFIADSDT
jgi:hypothetical protein